MNWKIKYGNWNEPPVTGALLHRTKNLKMQVQTHISEAFNLDCMEGMKQYPDKYFDLAIVDPEYGIGVGKMAFLQEIKTTVKQKNGSRLSPNKRPYSLKDWDHKPASQEYYDELVRVSSNQIIFGIEHFGWSGVGPGRIKWDKCVPAGLSFNRYETAYCSSIDTEVELPLLWSGMMQAKSLSEPTIQQGNKKLNERRIHPCHKPVMLYLSLLNDYAKPGDKILDTHLGSGSSRIAAYDLGFDFTGYEIDADYFRAQEQRFNDHIKQLKLI